MEDIIYSNIQTKATMGACCDCQVNNNFNYCPETHANPLGAAQLSCFEHQMTYEYQGVYCSCDITSEGDCYRAIGSIKLCSETMSDQGCQDFREAQSCSGTNCGTS